MLAYAHGGLETEGVVDSMGGALWSHWGFDPSLLLVLLVAICYMRGSYRLRRGSLRHRAIWNGWRQVSFWLSVLLSVMALAGPIDYLAGYYFSAHMVQHMLMMLVIVPLLMLSSPLLAVLYGLPERVRRSLIPSLARWGPLRGTWKLLMLMLPSLVLFEVVQIGWHFPTFYKLALFNEGFHYLQHFCFIFGAFFFWLNVVQPYPLKKKLHPLVICLGIFGATIINSIISAMIVFAEVSLYGYETVTNGSWGFSVLEDQRLGAALMWTMGSMLYLLSVGLVFFTYAIRTHGEDIENSQLIATMEHRQDAPA